MSKRYFFAATLILALALFLSLRGKNPNSSPATSHSQNNLQSAKSGNKLISTRTASKSDSLSNGLVRLNPSPDVFPSDNFPEFGTHEPEQLGEFFLPPLEARNITLPEAVQLILQSYVDVCTVTKQEPILFSVNFEKNTGKKIDLNLAGSSLVSMLLKVGIQFESHYSREEGKISFRSFPPDSQTPLTNGVTQSFSVTPSFQSDFSELLSRTPLSSNEPFDNEKLVLPPPAHELLEKIGIAKAEGSSASYLPANSTLIVKDSPENLALLSNLLEELNTHPTQFLTSTRVLKSIVPMEKLESLQQGAAPMQQLMREISQTKGSDLFTFPSIVSRSEQRGTVEVIHENNDSWTGTRIESNTSRYGFGQQHSLDFELRPGSTDEYSFVTAHKFQLEDVGPNTSSLVRTAKNEDGSYLHAISTTSMIDSTGQPFDPLGSEATFNSTIESP